MKRIIYCIKFCSLNGFFITFDFATGGVQYKPTRIEWETTVVVRKVGIFLSNYYFLQALKFNCF